MGNKITKLAIMAVSAFVWLGVITVPSPAVQWNQRGPTDATQPFSNPRFVEEFRLRIENREGGLVSVSKNSGKTWEKLGAIQMPAAKLNPEGYTASGWSQPGAVAATAVNSIHIKVRQNTEKGKGVIFSLVPAELMVKPENYKSYYNSSASIITDMPAGTGIFGRFSPYVGNPVFIETAGGLEPLKEDHVMRHDDVFIIQVMSPQYYPSEIDFENRFGGFITVKFPDGKELLVGQVLKPVYGVGRFDGSIFTDVGRLRANHSGVICLSTSPIGEIGGFQIIPENHGMSPEMTNARILTQWMVIGPLNALDPSTEAIAPFFKYYLSPRFWRSKASDSDWVDQVLGRLIWQVRLDNGEWQRPPTVTGRVDDGLVNLTHVRILLPLKEPEFEDAGK